jgi:hypothetical protein
MRLYSSSVMALGKIMHDDSATRSAMDARDSPGSSSRTRHARASRDARTLTLALLGAVFAVHFLDRQILAILIQPIKADLGLSDTALGLLSGLAFTVFFSTVVGVGDRYGDARVRQVAPAVFGCRVPKIRAAAHCELSMRS